MMRLELTKYIISICDREINIIDSSNKESLNMILFADYNYDILEVGFGLGYLDKTILKAEYCEVKNKEYYDLTISITMKDYIYIDIEGIDMDNNEMSIILNIKDKLISVDNN